MGKSAHRAGSAPKKDNAHIRGSKRQTGGYKQKKGSVPPKPFKNRNPAPPSSIMDAPKRRSPSKKKRKNSKPRKSKPPKRAVEKVQAGKKQEEKARKGLPASTNKEKTGDKPGWFMAHFPSLKKLPGELLNASLVALIGVAIGSFNSSEEPDKHPPASPTVASSPQELGKKVPPQKNAKGSATPKAAGAREPPRTVPFEGTEEYRIALSMHTFCSGMANPHNFALAVGNNDVDTTKKFLNCGMSPNTEESGKTMLMVAAEKGSLDVARILVPMGANVFAETKSGESALVYAAIGGHMGMVDFLNSKGADFVPRKQPVREGDPLLPPGWMPRERASELIEHSKSVPNPEFFLKFRGFTRSPKRNPYRKNAIALAISRGNISPGDLQELLKIRGVCINPSPACGIGSPLVSAAYRRDLEIVRILLKNGAGPNSREYMGVGEPRDLRRGTTPMIAASLMASSDEKEEILPILESLLQKGADPNIVIPEKYGKSALHTASRAGNFFTVDFLRENGTKE